MGRRLILMRHAKSSWAEQNQEDHARPLNDRGRRDAPRVAARLAELGWSPDAIWSSDARRTRETCDLIRAAFEPAPTAAFDRGLYLGDLDSIRASAVQWDAAARTVLTLGHNPGWSDAASELAGAPLGMSTADAVLLERAGEEASDEVWADALLGGWRLVDVVRAKEEL